MQKQTAKTAKTEANAKRGKAAQSEAPKTDDKPDLSSLILAARKQATEQIHAFDPDRLSIPVKSVAAYKRQYKRNVPPHVNGRNPSERQAAAITYAVLASGQRVAPGISFKRHFSHNGQSLVIENGCLADMQKAGLVSYDSATETLTIPQNPRDKNGNELPGATAAIIGQIGEFDKLA